MESYKNHPRINIPHAALVKAPGLLPMLYTASELAEDIGLPERTLRDWLAAGAPYHRDDNNRIWIDGKAFTQWLFDQRKNKPKTKVPDGHALCLKCNSIVEIVNPTIRPSKGKLIYIKGTCPECGSVINRGGSCGQ